MTVTCPLSNYVSTTLAPTSLLLRHKSISTSPQKGSMLKKKIYHMEKWTPGLIAFPVLSLHRQATGCLNCSRPKLNTVSCTYSSCTCRGYFTALSGTCPACTCLRCTGTRRELTRQTLLRHRWGDRVSRVPQKRISIPSAVKADSTGGPETTA